MSISLVPSAGIALLATAAAVSISSRERDRPRKGVIHDSRTIEVAKSPPTQSRLLGAHPDASVHHLVTFAGIKPHFHRTHDETVVILSGSGIIRMGGDVRQVSPGLTLLIPRGTVHSLEVTEGRVEAISVFSPEFDGQDRIFLDGTALDESQVSK